MEPTARKQTILMGGVIAVLFLLLVYGIGRLFSHKTAGPKATPSQSSTSSVSLVQKAVTPAAAASGSLKLSVQDTSGVVAVGEPATVRIVASSNGTPVVGYDVVISYDPSALSYQSASHPLSDYSGVVRTAPGKLTVSGFLKKQETKPWILSDTIITELQFKPLKTGKTMITIAFMAGATNESNLMSENARDILGQVTPLALNAGTPLKLNTGETRIIDKGPYALRLDAVTVPSPDCRDCFTSQDLTLINTGTNTASPFGFRSGGFAGTIHDEVRQGSYLFKLEKSGPASVTVIVASE